MTTSATETLDTMNPPRWNRKAYMAREVDHQTYYGQFATARIVALVGEWIGVDRIRASKDPYFNDIPISLWDGLGDYLLNTGAPELRALGISNQSTYAEPPARPGTSSSDRVCLVKAAARKIKETAA